MRVNNALYRCQKTDNAKNTCSLTPRDAFPASRTRTCDAFPKHRSRRCSDEGDGDKNDFLNAYNTFTGSGLHIQASPCSFSSSSFPSPLQRHRYGLFPLFVFVLCAPSPLVDEREKGRDREYVRDCESSLPLSRRVSRTRIFFFLIFLARRFPVRVAPPPFLSRRFRIRRGDAVSSSRLCRGVASVTRDTHFASLASYHAGPETVDVRLVPRLEAAFLHVAR